MGYLLRDEITALARVTESPERPFVAILGGAKVADKIGVIEALLGKCDAICIGGAMANTLLAAIGNDMKSSKLESDWLARGRTLARAGEEPRRGLRAADGRGRRRRPSRRRAARSCRRTRCPPGKWRSTSGPTR